MSKSIKIVVEKNQDGYIAYPLGVKAVIVGEGETYEEALADVKSAIKFHIESFGIDSLAFESDIPVLKDQMIGILDTLKSKSL